jgi:hypothetical protein
VPEDLPEDPADRVGIQAEAPALLKDRGELLLFFGDVMEEGARLTLRVTESL